MGSGTGLGGFEGCVGIRLELEWVARAAPGVEYREVIYSMCSGRVCTSTRTSDAVWSRFEIGWRHWQPAVRGDLREMMVDSSRAGVCVFGMELRHELAGQSRTGCAGGS